MVFLFERGLGQWTDETSRMDDDVHLIVSPFLGFLAFEMGFVLELDKSEFLFLNKTKYFRLRPEEVSSERPQDLRLT